MGGCEFVEEPGVVLGEEAQVVDLVLEVGDALYTHAECESRVFLAVDAAGFEHSGSTMPQPRISTHPVCLQNEHPFPPQRLHEMSISAEGSVKEIAWTQTYLSLGAEHLTGEVEKCLSQVGE